MVNPRTVISTFAGCGGSSLGYKMAGYHELLATDWDEHAEQTFRANFPEVNFWRGDISKLSVEEVFKITGLKRGELGVFDGSPPCQGFSMSGKRKVSDSRNQLFNEFKRLLDGLYPKAFVMENVASMASGSMKGIFNDIFEALTENYVVRATVLDSSDYGVPQSRRRMIFIGARKDLNIIPTFPKPYGKPITVREALKGCPVDAEVMYPTGNLAPYAFMTKQGESASKYHPKGHYFNLRRLAGGRPAYTISKMFATSIGAGLMHPTEQRYVTISEVKRLCSFPDSFIFDGAFKDKWARMGNAVMPKFMEAVAKHVAETILEPKEAIRVLTDFKK